MSVKGKHINLSWYTVGTYLANKISMVILYLGRNQQFSLSRNLLIIFSINQLIWCHKGLVCFFVILNKAVYSDTDFLPMKSAFSWRLMTLLSLIQSIRFEDCTVWIYVKTQLYLFFLLQNWGKAISEASLKVCLPSPESSFGASKWGRYHDMLCKYSSSQYPQGFISEVIFTLHLVHSSSLSISDGKRAVVTTTVRLEAMSAKIAQAVEQGQSLLLFTQRLPIIRLGKAGCLLLLY